MIVRPCAALLAAVLLAFAGIRPCAADNDAPGRAGPFFLVLKTGERDATQKKAGKVVSELGRLLAPDLGLASLEARVTNKPAQALEVLRQGPVFAIVTPAFLFAHEKEFGLAALRETRRLGLDGEAYSLVVRKGGGPVGEKSRVATTLADEEAYVRKVVLAPLGAGPARAELHPVKNLADAVFDLTEGGGPCSAVLFDRLSRDFFERDPLVWPKLEVVATSASLPPDLVVVPGGRAETAKKLGEAIDGLLRTEEGRKVCKSLQTEGFGAVDARRLDEARRRFSAPEEGGK